MQRFIISPLFALSRFFINIYGIFLKVFSSIKWWLLVKNWFSRKYYRGKNKKNRRFYILPFYILLALLFGLLSALYWYFVILHVPLSIERYLSPLNNNIALIIAFATFFGWLYILCKTNK